MGDTVFYATICTFQVFYKYVFILLETINA